MVLVMRFPAIEKVICEATDGTLSLTRFPAEYVDSIDKPILFFLPHLVDSVAVISKAYLLQFSIG